MKSQNVRRKY